MKKVAILIIAVSFTASSCNNQVSTGINQSSEIQEQKSAPEKTKSSCDPNYSGCVPIASDVDCAGGSGNGPAYISGPLKVIGTDIYGLDRDHDGFACE